MRRPILLIREATGKVEASGRVKIAVKDLSGHVTIGLDGYHAINDLIGHHVILWSKERIMTRNLQATMQGQLKASQRVKIAVKDNFRDRVKI